MEIFWYIFASTLAGIGTGLAGLSAATVMVPILITLCPSFLGNTGAYQATAIALASDILGSAVTSYVYIQNKNIDLKRGWIMMACILSMCTVGSFAAWKAGNVVLGAFTLFLTFFIGIRFLVKPDTSKKDTSSTSSKLGLKGVLISLFFGLTIGFGTGFVGTGGGMMMLVVFTAFLGMDLKSAVGTSTFIMTFTALIASTSHILIHPAIVLEKWDVLIICIVCATIASLVSAKFANKVDNKTIGLTTGIVLVILGGAMIILHYWDLLSKYPLIIHTCISFIDFFEYVIPIAIGCVILRFLIKIPPYIFRKMLHIIAFSSISLMIHIGSDWLSVSLACVLIAVLIYPILKFAESFPWFSGLFVQKKQGEIKLSLLLLFFMAAFVNAIGWGVFHKAYISSCAIIMWGVGDAFAAIIGIPLGKHKIKWKLSDGKKSYEGCLGMFLSSFICGFITLLIKSNGNLFTCILLSACTAFVCMIVELISKNGNDTFTVPISALLILSIFNRFI